MRWSDTAKYPDYESAIEILDSLEAAGHEDNFGKLLRLIIVLRQDIENCHKLKSDADLHEDVYDIAHEHDKGCVNAQALLHFVFKTQFPEVLIFPNGGSQRLSNTTIEGTSSSFTMFPNPAQSTLTVHLSDSVVAVSNKFEITNVFGEVVYSSVENSDIFTVSLDNFAPGLYFCVTYRNGEATETQKLVVEQH